MDEQQIKLAEELFFSHVKTSSFAKKLYFGLFDAHQVMPFPKVSDEEKKQTEILLKKLNQFADTHLDPARIDKEASIPDHVVAGLAELGVLGVITPKAHGGLGMSHYAFCKVVETLARRCGSTALFVNVNQSIGLKALLLFGTEQQKAKWLPPLAKGQKFSAFSLTEPNAGSDASGVETFAEYIPEKNVYRINGRKQWTTNGSIAHVLTVMAQTKVDTPKGKQDKITAFLVTPDMPGFKIVVPALEKVGMRGTRTANLAFENMEVPAENILGPMGGGLRVCLTILDFGRTAFGALCTGAAKFCVEKAVNHARTRHQFKRPLATFGLVKQKISHISALAYAMDATTYLTAGLIDDGAEDIMLESAMLKVFASDSLWTIIYETMQIYGGRSFFTDEPFERMMRDARLNMIGEGSNEVMRAFIGAVGIRDVGLELKGVVDSLKTPLSSYPTLSKFFKQMLHRIKAVQVPVNSPLLQQESADLGKAVRKFGFAVIKALGTYKEGIVEQQHVLNRLASSAIALYTATAVLSKLDSELARVNGDAAALNNDVEIGKFYCHLAMKSIKTHLDHLHDPEDQKIDTLSDHITGLKPYV